MTETPTPAPAVSSEPPVRAITKITVPDPHTMVRLLGAGDEILKLVERAVNSDVHVRGNEITITGAAADNALAERIFSELMQRTSEIATSLRPGVDLGALATQAQRERVDDLIQQARSWGARLVCGGDATRPTILDCTDAPGADIVAGEHGSSAESTKQHVLRRPAPHTAQPY